MCTFSPFFGGNLTDKGIRWEICVLGIAKYCEIYVAPLVVVVLVFVGIRLSL